MKILIAQISILWLVKFISSQDCNLGYQPGWALRADKEGGLFVRVLNGWPGAGGVLAVSHLSLCRNLWMPKQDPDSCSFVRTITKILFSLQDLDGLTPDMNSLTSAQCVAECEATSHHVRNKAWKRSGKGWSITASTWNTMSQVSLRYLAALCSLF